MPDFDAAVRALAFITEDELAEKELLCPTDVPMRRLASFVRSKASELMVVEQPTGDEPS
jgi:hypothetical protein